MFHGADEPHSIACLTGIPSELRLIIYNFIGTGRVHAEFDIGPKTVYGVQPDRTTRTFAALMRTCRLIRKETEGMLYGSDLPASIDIFNNPWSQRSSLYWRSLTAKSFDYLQSLRRVELCLSVHSEDMESDVHVQLVMRLFQVLSSLETSTTLEEFNFSLCVSKRSSERLQELRDELDGLCDGAKTPWTTEDEESTSKSVNLDFSWRIARFLKLMIVKNDQFGRAKEDCVRELKAASWLPLLTTKLVSDNSHSTAYVVAASERTSLDMPSCTLE